MAFRGYPIFLPLLSVMVAETYKGSSDDAFTTSRALGVDSAFHFGLLLVEFCRLFSFANSRGKKTPPADPDKQAVME